MISLSDNIFFSSSLLIFISSFFIISNKNLFFGLSEIMEILISFWLISFLGFFSIISFGFNSLNTVNLKLFCSSGANWINCFGKFWLIKLDSSITSLFWFCSNISLFLSLLDIWFNLSSLIFIWFSFIWFSSLSFVNEIFLFSYVLSILNWMKLSIFWIFSIFWISFSLIIWLLSIFLYELISSETISLFNNIFCLSLSKSFPIISLLFIFSVSILFLLLLMSISSFSFSIFLIFSKLSISLYSFIIFSTVNLLLSWGTSSKVGIFFSFPLIFIWFSEVIILFLNILLCIMFFL